MRLCRIDFDASLDSASAVSAILSSNRPLLQKFNSTITQFTSVSAYDLQFAAGKSFATRDYYNDIIGNAISTKESDDASQTFIALSVISILSSSIVIPQIPIDVLPIGGAKLSVLCDAYTTLSADICITSESRLHDDTECKCFRSQ